MIETHAAVSDCSDWLCGVRGNDCVRLRLCSLCRRCRGTHLSYLCRHPAWFTCVLRGCSWHAGEMIRLLAERDVPRPLNGCCTANVQ